MLCILQGVVQVMRQFGVLQAECYEQNCTKYCKACDFIYHLNFYNFNNLIILIFKST